MSATLGRSVGWTMLRICLFGVAAAVAGCGGGASKLVTVAYSGRVRPLACARVSSGHAPASRIPAAKLELVPAGVAAVRLCGYAATNAQVTGGLAVARLVTDRELFGRLTRELDQLPVQHGTVVCPFDTGALVILRFAYRSGPGLDVRVELSGCEIADNGTVARSASGFGTPPEPVPPLVSELKKLTAAA